MVVSWLSEAVRVFVVLFSCMRSIARVIGLFAVSGLTQPDLSTAPTSSAARSASTSFAPATSTRFSPRPAILRLLKESSLARLRLSKIRSVTGLGPLGGRGRTSQIGHRRVSGVSMDL